MRLIFGAIRSTPLNWLQTMSNTAPPMVRRETANQKSFNRIASLLQHTPIVNILAQAPDSSRLISRRPFYKWWILAWPSLETIWAQDTTVNGDLINDPTQKLPGFSNLSRNLWTISNGLISKQGRTKRNLYRWGVSATPECPRCGHASQDTDHQVLHCPVTAVHEGGAEYRRWFDEVRIQVWSPNETTITTTNNNISFLLTQFDRKGLLPYYNQPNFWKPFWQRLSMIMSYHNLIEFSCSRLCTKI